MILTALSIYLDREDVMTLGRDEPVRGDEFWRVDYTLQSDLYSADADYSHAWHSRESAIYDAIEILQGELSR